MPAIPLRDKIQGLIAHGATNSGNPFKMGGKATTGEVSGVSDGQIVDAAFDINGRQLVVTEPKRNTGTVTISNGGTTSGAWDCGVGRTLVGLQSPAAFDALNLYFAGSNDNNTFGDIYDDSGTRYCCTVGTLAAVRMIVINPALFVPYRYVKVISSGNVAADRIWTLISRPLA